jgi:hypothetical protein
MSKTLALDFGCVLRTTSALVALGFFPAVLPAQQVLAGGANLFAPSPHVGALVPYGQAPPGGWSLLAWSHGTSGVARECAPSRMKSLFYHWQTLGVAHLEGTIQDPDFLGTVALAGASDLEDGLDSVLRAKIPVLNGLVALWVYGVKTVYPELDLKDLLTSKALAIYNPSLKMDAAPPVVPLRLSPQTKSSFPGGRRTNTSWSSSSGINQAEERPMGLCHWLAVATTSCLANPRAERFCTGFARPVRAFSEISIRDLETIPWYMGPCETSWIVALPGLLQSRHQAIVRRHRLSTVDMALEERGRTVNCCRGGSLLIEVKACKCA